MKVLAVRLSAAFPAAESGTRYLKLIDSVDIVSRKRIAAFRHLEDSQRCLLGRLLPRFYFSTVHQISWAAIESSATELGRPFARYQSNALPDFNISHDSDWVVMAVLDQGSSVGIDIMRLVNPFRDESIEDFVATVAEQLTPHEHNYINASSNDTIKLRRAFALWTLKEAYAKAIGRGLHFDFKRIEFHLSGSEQSTNCSVEALLDGQAMLEWQFVLCELEEGYLMAAAIENGAVIDSGEHNDLPAWITFVSIEEIVTAAQVME